MVPKHIQPHQYNLNISMNKKPLLKIETLRWMNSHYKKHTYHTKQISPFSIHLKIFEKAKLNFIDR